MAVTYTTAVKTSRMTATRDDVAAGALELLTTGDVLLATFTLSAGGGTISADVWTLTFAASTVAAVAAGTATKAQIKNSGGTAQITGLTVGTSGTDIVLDNNVIASAQNVTLTSATITHA